MAERHARENSSAMQLEHNRSIIESFLIKDMQAYVLFVSVFSASEHIYRPNPFPPRRQQQRFLRPHSPNSSTSALTSRPGVS